MVHWVSEHFVQVYQDMDLKKKVQYRTYVISPFHNIGACAFAVYAMFYICGESPTGEKITVYNDSTCFETCRYLHIWALLHTCSYFIVDLVYTALVIREHSDLDQQMYAHHTLSSLAFYLTFLYMNWITVFCVMIMFVEISSTYVCVRWLLYTHKAQNSWVSSVNAMFLFFTFLFGRLIFQLYITIAFAAPWYYVTYMDGAVLLWWMYVVNTILLGSLALSIGMNIYWMALIIQQVARLFRRNADNEND